MQSLYLIRHAQSIANANQIVAGSDESPLSELGKQQAAYAGQTARQFLTFDLIMSSPMKRALQTAHTIAQQIGYPIEHIVVIDDLRERDLGVAEGKDYTQVPHHNGNYEDAENVAEVEPIEDFYNRVHNVLQIINQRPEQHILVVCHNGCGRMLQVAARTQPPLSMYQQPRLENAVFYRLR